MGFHLHHSKYRAADEDCLSFTEEDASLAGPDPLYPLVVDPKIYHSPLIPAWAAWLFCFFLPSVGLYSMPFMGYRPQDPDSIRKWLSFANPVPEQHYFLLSPMIDSTSAIGWFVGIMLPHMLLGLWALDRRRGALNRAEMRALEEGLNWAGRRGAKQGIKAPKTILCR